MKSTLTKMSTSFRVSTSGPVPGWASGGIKPLSLRSGRLWRRKNCEYTEISLFPSHLGFTVAPSLPCSKTGSLRTPLNKWAVIFFVSFAATAPPKVSNKSGSRLGLPLNSPGLHLNSPEAVVFSTELAFHFALNYPHTMLLCSPYNCVLHYPEQCCRESCS